MILSDTLERYEKIIYECKTLFVKKHKDYGDAWRILRPISITDQIYIKAFRIRSIQEKKVQKVSDSVTEEFIGIINYAVIALMMESLSKENGNDKKPLTNNALEILYDTQTRKSKAVFEKKNHDYNEAWRQMSEEAIVDLILMKIYRLRQIIKNDGTTIASEGTESNYLDIINYAIFALIKQSELCKK